MEPSPEGRLAKDVERLLNALVLPEPAARPALVIISGLPGTGKSHFASKLAERVPCVVLESDALRKQLFIAPSYSRQESSYLFAVIHELLRRLLARGIPTILDATNLSERNREYLYSIAEQAGATLVLVEMRAPADVVRMRLTERFAGERSGGYSDADWEVYQKMTSTVEAIRRHHFVVDSSRDISSIMDKIVKEIEQHA